MITPPFLQSFMAGSVRELRRALRNEFGMSKRAAKAVTDIDLIRLACIGADDFLPAAFQLLHLIGPSKAQCCALLTTIAPFFRKWTDQEGSIFCHPVVAVRPTAELVENFADARPPDGSEQMVDEQLRVAACYLDLPHLALMVGQNQEIRAIFASPFINDNGDIVITAVTTRLGTDHIMARLSWVMGTVGCVGVNLGVDTTHLKTSVEALLRLVVLFNAIAADKQQPAAPSNRRGRGNARDRVAVPRREVPPPFSLFRLRHLTPPADRFGRPRDTVTKGGWKLQYRVAVKGFFRTQWHGPKHALRKMVWVDAYGRGPLDAPVRQEMTVLRPQDGND